MKTSHLIAYSVVALLVTATGCGKKDVSGSSSEASAESKSEVVDVAALDKAGDEDLASPNKAEAREWLKAPSHGVFKGEKQAVVKFVSECYAAGAVNEREVFGQMLLHGGTVAGFPCIPDFGLDGD